VKRTHLILAIGFAVSVVAWLAGGELPFPARACTAFLLGLFPAFALLQAAAIGDVEALPARSRLYITTIVGLWALTFAVAFAASESGFHPRLMGVVEMPLAPFAIWTCIALAAVGALVLAFKAFGVDEAPVLAYLVPNTRVEKLWYAGVSLTAGICEEFVFRGFLVAALRVATGSFAVAALLSAITFGIAHAHQKVGALRAALLGLVLTVPLIMTGSLYPGIAAHALIDLIAGLWAAKWLIKA
jgi:membrane protease YdiL (CAAX protease family)